MILPLWVNSPSVCSKLCTGCGPPFGLDIFGSGLRSGCPSQFSVLVKVCLLLGPGFSTALDIEEVLSGIGGDQLHVMVADVIKPFDTVDRCTLDCALGRLGLPDWFRRTYFACHSQVRIRFKLAAGPWGALV